MTVTISRCAAEDVPALVRFIDEEWKRGHALATSRALLDWQYRNADGSYSFVIARRGDAIIGIVGYIATRRYDPALADANVLWLTTWKVRADAHVAALGLSLLQHVERAEPHAAIGAVGFNPQTRPMYAALGYRVGELDHSVARRRNADGELAAESIDDPRQCDELTVAGPPGVAPRKTPRYFASRYLRHPFYRYSLVALRDPRGVVGLMAARVAEHDSLRALRIVDFLGDAAAFARSGAAVQSMIRTHDAAYADIYHAGLDPSALASAAFTRVDPDGAEIVPDHFEPFEDRNVRLWYAMRGDVEPMVFKGDSDQDRPNRIEDTGR